MTRMLVNLATILILTVSGFGALRSTPSAQYTEVSIAEAQEVMGGQCIAGRDPNSRFQCSSVPCFFGGSSYIYRFPTMGSGNYASVLDYCPCDPTDQCQGTANCGGY